MAANGAASRGSASTPTHRANGHASTNDQRLSCEECQKRKSKCDKQVPCAMCKSRGIACTPTFLDPHRPRKKRFPERELLDRIQRYEKLLSAAGIDKDLNPSDLADVSSAVLASRATKRSRLSSNDSTCSAESQRGTAMEHRSSTRSEAAPPSLPGTASIDPDIGDIESILETVPPLRIRSVRAPQHSESLPQLSQVDSSQSGFQHTLTASGHAAYAPNSDVAVSSTLVIHKHLDLMFPEDGSKYFNLDDHCPGEPLRHPETSIMFRLLHIYEQNIHPLVKVVHMPSVRERFCDISADPNLANTQDDAIMFAIYTIAVGTLTSDECERLFGSRRRETVWEPFRRNTQTALCRIQLWRSSHIGAVQAYLLYLLTLTKDVDPRTYGVCSGSIGRMVQRLLSLHNKRSPLGSINAPVKAVNQEMGVRLWWEILACDMRACEKSGIAASPTLATATTILPRNASDADLEQLAAASVTAVPDASVDTPITECLFLLLRSELAQFQLHPPWSQQHPGYHLRSHLFRSTAAYRKLFDSNTRRVDTSSLSWRLAAVDAFDAYVAKRYFDRPEATTSSLVQYASHHAQIWINKIRLFVHLNQRSPENDAKVIQICTVQVQETAKLLGNDRFVRFQWYTYQQLPFFSFVILLDLLRRHSAGKLVDEAWTAIAKSSVIWHPSIATKSCDKLPNSIPSVVSNTPPNSNAASKDSTPNIYADWGDKTKRNNLRVRGTMLAALMVAAWEKRAQALIMENVSKPGYVPEEPTIVAAMRDAATVHYPLPALDRESAQAQAYFEGNGVEPSAIHAGAGRSDGHQPGGQWSAGMMDPTSLTAFLDPAAGTSTSAIDDMLNLNSLLQSSVDLDWSGWFSQSWASTPGAMGLSASPTNFIPSL